MLVLESSRLRLRPFGDGDAAPFSAYRSDPEVARYQSWEPPFSLAQAREFIRSMEASEPGAPGVWYQLAVERKTEPGLIGDCVFRIQASDPEQAEIGFTLSPGHQGQGYATEAVERLLAHLFLDRRLHRVTAICDAENLRSARLLARVGMRREGHLIENIRFKGRWGSEFLYAIRADEWKDRTVAADVR